MMNTRPLIVLALLLCLSRPVAIAQDDDSRRWAIDFRLSPVKPVVTFNETPDKYYDPIKTGGGPNFSAHIEYFIPQTGFSVVGGYDHEVMDFYSATYRPICRRLCLADAGISCQSRARCSLISVQAPSGTLPGARMQAR